MENESNVNALPNDGVVDYQTDDVFDAPEFNDENAEVEDVDFEADNNSSNADDVETDQGEEEDLADPQDDSTQSKEENAIYKKMRLKAEAEAKAKFEKEMEQTRKELQAQKMAIQQQASEKKIIEEYLNPTKVYQYADENNVSEEMATKLLRYEAQKIIDAEKTKVQENFAKLQADKNDLRNDKYFSLLEKEVDSIVEANPNVDYKAVYYYQRGLKSDEFDKKLAKNVEQRTIANMQDRSRRRTIQGDAGTDNNISPADVLDKDSLDMTIAFGHDPRGIAKYVKSNYKKKGR